MTEADRFLLTLSILIRNAVGEREAVLGGFLRQTLYWYELKVFHRPTPEGMEEFWRSLRQNLRNAQQDILGIEIPLEEISTDDVPTWTSEGLVFKPTHNHRTVELVVDAHTGRPYFIGSLANLGEVIHQVRDLRRAELFKPIPVPSTSRWRRFWAWILGL